MVSSLITAVLFFLFACTFGFMSETAQTVQQATSCGYSGAVCIVGTVVACVAAWLEA